MKLPAVGSLQVRLALSLAAVYLAATAIAIVVLLYQAYSTADALSKEASIAAPATWRASRAPTRQERRASICPTGSTRFIGRGHFSTP
jgi:hypothetical protein